uniref:SET domain-containing protein n=1 Tax=Angiostrongylus cantonensis TaxID=6313 RepID=A0A158P9X6_ANGCA
MIVSKENDVVNIMNFKAGPESATPEIERESYDNMSPNEVEGIANDAPTSYGEVVLNTGSTPVKRFVIADSDDDVTDAEDDELDSSKPDERIYVGDHDYAVSYNLNPVDEMKSSEVFPLIPGLSELGLISDGLEIASDQHVVQSRTFTPSQVGYEQREPNIINSTRLGSGASSLLMQQRQPNAMTNAPLIQRQADPPPHRTLHQGSDPPPHRVLLLQGSAGSRVAFSPADPSQAALANAPAPLIVSSRGTRPIRTAHIAQETSSLPENFVDDDGGAEYSDVPCKEEEKKRIEAEVQVREKRRPMGDGSSVRRRSGYEIPLTGGEQIELGDSAPVSPRSRGRPKGAGRARSSLSSSSSTSVAAPGATPSYHDMPDVPSSTARTADYQSLRSSGRSSARTTPAATAYDGSMAPELPPPLPPVAGTASRSRGTYHNTNLASPSHVHSQKIPVNHDANSQSYHQRDLNGFHQDDDLADISTDPSSDDEEIVEEPEWGDYVTRCLCEMQHNDEWMVECEQCNVWQHMKCMGLDPKKFNQSDTYLCERCRPRPLKYTKKQAQDLQIKQLRALSREKERKMLEKLRRREEKKRAKLNRRLKERNVLKFQHLQQGKATKRGPAAFKKFQMIRRNEYTKRAKQMLALFDTTAGAQSILENSRDLKRGKRMFVAPDVEGLVATESIKQDDVIMEYVGHVCLPDECPGRLQRGALQPFCVLYNGLGQNLLCIDARRQGSDARFARRCCRSNSTLKHVLLNGCIYVMLVASEKIDKGTEVTIPFDCDFRDTLVPVECACGDDPSCYMRQFNNSLRGKTSFEERGSQSLSTRLSNGSTSSRKTTTAQKSKVESHGQPKRSGKKEKSSESLRKKGARNKKPKKIRIRLHRHYDNKNTKSSDDSLDQGNAVEHENEREVDTVEEQKANVRLSCPARSKESVENSEIRKKNEESLESELPQPSNNKIVDVKKTAPHSSKKEEYQLGAKRRASIGSSRFPKREAVELKEVMDYTLPEDRNKPSREERKLQAVVAAFEKKEEKEKKKKIEGHKDANNVKDKKVKACSTSMPRTFQGTGRSSRTSTREDSKENEVVEVTTMAQPPRKRWAAAVKENEVTQRASSPEVTSSSSTPSAGPSDIGSAYSVNPNSVGGKKLWLRRHAAESVSEESLQATDISATSEPQSCAADSTSDIAAVPLKVQISPLKKRRHILDACRYDEHVAATALAQMGGKSAEGFRFHWNVALRCVMSNFNDGENTEFQLAEVIQKPLPLPSLRNGSKPHGTVAVDTSTAPTSSQLPMSTNEAKRLSLEDYKRRRSTMGSSDNGNASSRVPSQSFSGTTTNDRKNHIGENMTRPTRSFMPSMDSPMEQNPVLPPLDTDIPIPSLGVPPDLEVVKKMILQESCIPPPPAPPSLSTQKESPTSAAVASSSDMSIASSSESGEERMSLADRLAKEFGVGTAGTYRHSPKTTTPSGQRPCVVADVPPPPPPGPRPTRSTR